MRGYVNMNSSRCYEILDPAIIEWDEERKRRQEEHPREQPRIDIDGPDRYRRMPPEEEKESDRGIVHIQLRAYNN